MSVKDTPGPNEPAVGFVDLHSHPLPEVDDGPSALEGAIEIVRRAAAGGTVLMVATPHGDARRKWDNVQTLDRWCQELNETLRQEKLPLTLVLGMENPVEMQVLDKLEEGNALTLNNSRYVLMELPFLQLPLYWEEVLFQLQLKGLIPVIAHPERQAQIQNDPELIAGVVERGVLLQVTAASLAGRFGPAVKKAAEILVRKGLVHILASDCHAPDGPRGPEILAGFRAAEKLVGREAAIEMVSGMPRAIVGMGEPSS